MSLAEHMLRLNLKDAAVAQPLGVTAEAVRLWRHGKRRIPAERAAQVEAEFGIPRHELRPDLYQSPEAQADAA